MHHLTILLIISGVIFSDFITAQPIDSDLSPEIPCTVEVLEVNKGLLRSSGTGSADSELLALKKAIFNARNELAQQLQVKVYAAAEHQVKITKEQNKMRMDETYSNRITAAVDQSLSGVRTVCKNVEATDTGYYRANVVLELDAKSLLLYMKDVYGTDTIGINNFKARFNISD